MLMAHLIVYCDCLFFVADPVKKGKSKEPENHLDPGKLTI